MLISGFCMSLLRTGQSLFSGAWGTLVTPINDINSASALWGCARDSVEQSTWGPHLCVIKSHSSTSLSLCDLSTQQNGLSPGGIFSALHLRDWFTSLSPQAAPQQF
jgi:hypothetical protein